MAPKRKASPSPPPSAKKKLAGAAVKAEPASEAPRFSPTQGFTCGLQWPAPLPDMKAATAFILRLVGEEGADPFPLSASRPLVILPDKDADGLCSGQIFHRTLRHLGLSDELIRVHHLTKGTNAASPKEVEALRKLNPAAIVLLDQGSRPGPPLLGEGDQTPTLVIDHHYLKPGETGPRNALMLNACHSPPVATASLLTWTICRPLWKDAAQAETAIDWLAVLGTAGDLSVNVEWQAPWPDMTGEMKKWTKKRIGTAIALLNAPRRTPEFDVAIAYASLDAAKTPLELLDPAVNRNAKRLYEAREAVAAEAERCTHTPPKFSKDGRIAVLFIDSPYQVHPGIATRWSGALRGAKQLQVVMAANRGYSPTGTHTHFSCRRAGAALKRGENPNIIALLHEYAARDPTFLTDVVETEARLEREGKGEPEADAGPVSVNPDEQKGSVEALNFARGHKEASGGVSQQASAQRRATRSD